MKLPFNSLKFHLHFPRITPSSGHRLKIASERLNLLHSGEISYARSPSLVGGFSMLQCLEVDRKTTRQSAVIQPSPQRDSNLVTLNDDCDRLYYRELFIQINKYLSHAAHSLSTAESVRLPPTLLETLQMETRV